MAQFVVSGQVDGIYDRDRSRRIHLSRLKISSTRRSSPNSGAQAKRMEFAIRDRSRIHGELLKLGIDIGQTSVAKYMARRRRPPSQGWRTFLLNHTGGIAWVLRPGGRLVIGDMHWDSWIWHSTEPERMAKMMSAWDDHLADRGVPARLPHMMRQAGYQIETIRPLVLLDTVLRNDGVAMMLLNLMQAYVLQNDLVDEPTARAWADEQRRLAADGCFFFSLVHFVLSGRRT